MSETQEIMIPLLEQNATLPSRKAMLGRFTQQFQLRAEPQAVAAVATAVEPEVLPEAEDRLEPMPEPEAAEAEFDPPEAEFDPPEAEAAEPDPFFDEPAPEPAIDEEGEPGLAEPTFDEQGEPSVDELDLFAHEAPTSPGEPTSDGNEPLPEEEPET